MFINIVLILITLLIGLLLSDNKSRDNYKVIYIIKHIKIYELKNKIIRRNFAHRESERRLYVFIICILMIFHSGLRHVAVGADTYAYFLQFEAVKNISWEKIYIATINHYSIQIGKDPGYLIFQKAVQYFIPYYQLFLFLIAIIFFTAFGYFLLKNTKKISELMFAFILYLSLFYSFFSFTGHRQTIATAGILYSYEYIKKRKIIPFIVIILIASTIHKSCLIFIIFYFIAPIKKNNLLLWILVLFPILFTFSNIFANLIISFTSDYDEYKHYDNLQPITFSVMMLLIGISSACFYKKSLIKNPYAVHYFNAFAAAIFFTSLIFSIHGYMRIVQYFSIFMVLLIPTVFNSIENHLYKTRQIIYAFCVLFLVTMSIRANFNMEYKFFWQQMNLGKNYTNRK